MNIATKLNNQSKFVKIFDLSNSEDVNELIQILEETKSILPIPLNPVLASITSITENGKSQWYEVVYHDGTDWCCYAGSNTFKDGEQVSVWKSCNDIL
jgi:hypothetical protein